MDKKTLARLVYTSGFYWLIRKYRITSSFSLNLHSSKQTTLKTDSGFLCGRVDTALMLHLRCLWDIQVSESVHS